MASQPFGTTSTSKPADAILVPVGADIQSLVDASPAGSTFWIQAGEHRMQSVTPKDNDRFIGEQGAVLNGSKLITDFDKEGSNWVATGQTQEGDRRGTENGAPGAERAGYPETFFIDNKPLTPVDSLDKVAPGKFYFDYAGDKIYFQDNPSGHRVEAGVSPVAFAGPASGVVVENLVVEKYNTPTQVGTIGYDSSAKDWTIQNNEVRLNYGVGVYAGSDSKVEKNYIHDNGQMGLGASGNNILVESNEIAHNGYFSGIDRGWEGGGTKFALTDNLTVRGNYSHDNNGYGLWTDIDNINTLYEGNTVTNNLSGGISHEISYAATIRNNVITGNGADSEKWLWGGGIQIQNSKDVDVYGNHVDASTGGNGITMIQQDRGSGAYGPWTTTGNKVHDNVIVDATPNEGISGSIADYDQAGLRAGGNSFDNNKYYVGDQSDAHWAWTNDFYSWDDYRQASGQDAHSTLSSTIPAAPAAPSSAANTQAPAVVDVAQPDPTPAATQPVPAEPTDPPVPSSPAPVIATPAAVDTPAPSPSAPVIATPAAVDTPNTGSEAPSPAPSAPVPAQPADPVSADPGTPVQASPAPAANVPAETPPNVSVIPADPAPATTETSPKGHDVSASGGSSPWASFFGEHGGHWMFSGHSASGGSGNHSDIDWQSIKNVFHHYTELAAQHCGAQASLDVDAMSGLVEHFHHAHTGHH